MKKVPLLGSNNFLRNWNTSLFLKMKPDNLDLLQKNIFYFSKISTLKTRSISYIYVEKAVKNSRGIVFRDTSIWGSSSNTSFANHIKKVFLGDVRF